MTDGPDPPGLPPALVAAPREPDRAVLSAALDEIHVPHRTVDTLDRIRSGAGTAGCLILAQEAIVQDLLDAMAALLADQPVWSEFPIIVLTTRDTPVHAFAAMLRRRWIGAKIVFLERPVGGVEFGAAVQLAISARLRQFQIRDQIERERLLRRELNHRVKNMFATVQSVAKITLRTASDPEQAFARFADRLNALDEVHVLLNSADEEGADFVRLADRVLGPYRPDEADPIRVMGPPDPLENEAANVIGLCLFELATNAVKYGALSTPDGRIDVALERVGTGDLRLTWTERGGPPAREPARKGFGSRFVGASLGALFSGTTEMTFSENGLSVTAEGPARDLFRTAGVRPATDLSGGPIR